MNLSVIANRIGIDKYPEEMDRVYETVKDSTLPACDLALIASLQETYCLFGSFYADVLETAEKINADPDRSAWVRVAAEYVKKCNVKEAKEACLPDFAESKVNAFLPLHILIPQIPESVRQYTQRGFSQEEVSALLRSYADSLSAVEKRTGMPGLTPVYYAWQCLYAKTAIYEIPQFQFELQALPAGAVYLKNRQSGEVVAVMYQGTFHATGMQLLGSKGFEDPAGAFQVCFEEDAENYYGHRSVGIRVQREKEVFPKSKWTCVARPGEDCLGIHVSRGADISKESVDSAIALGRKILAQRFPEHGGDKIFIASWLLDPTLEEVLTERSRIIQFARRFVRYPQKSDDTHALGFVFPNAVENFEDLPEDTGLQRGVKKLYLSGKFIHFYHGCIVE